MCSTGYSTRVKPLGRPLAVGPEPRRVKGGRRGVLAEAKVEEKIVPTACPTAVQPLAELQRRSRPLNIRRVFARFKPLNRGIHVVYTWYKRGIHVIYTWYTRDIQVMYT